MLQKKMWLILGHGWKNGSIKIKKNEDNYK